jgi:hypothetical protein
MRNMKEDSSPLMFLMSLLSKIGCYFSTPSGVSWR